MALPLLGIILFVDSAYSQESTRKSYIERYKNIAIIENTLYHVNMGDWTSWYLSVLNNLDATEIEVINFLKNELAKVK